MTIDGREASNIAGHHPDLVAELRDTWDRFNDSLLPYPSDHRGLPSRAPGDNVERSQPD